MWSEAVNRHFENSSVLCRKSQKVMEKMGNIKVESFMFEGHMLIASPDSNCYLVFHVKAFNEEETPFQYLAFGLQRLPLYSTSR